MVEEITADKNKSRYCLFGMGMRRFIAELSPNYFSHDVWVQCGDLWVQLYLCLSKRSSSNSFLIAGLYRISSQQAQSKSKPQDHKQLCFFPSVEDHLSSLAHVARRYCMQPLEQGHSCLSTAL